MKIRLLACVPALVTGLLGSCFNPDISGLTILCSADAPSCPDGRTCINNVCVAAGGDQGGPGGPITDGGNAGDQAGGGASGCADGSRNAVGVAYACAGPYAVGSARQLCAANWHPCTKAAGIDLKACGKLPGFFIADVPAIYQGNYNSESCGTGGNNAVWYGCGGLKTGTHVGFGCSGFTTFLDCHATGLTCSIANQSLDTTGDTSNMDGVLCCQ